MTPKGHPDLPADLSKFLDSHISSVAHLELLFLLFENQNRNWSAGDLARELRTNEAYAAQQAGDLRSFMTKENELYKYRPSPEADALIHRLIECYRARRHAVINAIYMKPVDGVRSFADAFKIKKDEGSK